MGMAVGCNVGDRHAMFEPIHGSAPALAGKDKANPLAMILAVGEALAVGWGVSATMSGLPGGEVGAAAVAAAVREGTTLPADLVGEARGAPMSKVGEAVRHAIAEHV